MCAGGCGGTPQPLYQQVGMTREQVIAEIAKTIQWKDLEQDYEIEIRQSSR